MNKAIRWAQRFENLQRMFDQLQRSLAIASPSDIEKLGIIRIFEFTIELAWKTLKDYLESQKVTAQFPREVIKESFHYAILQSKDVWMDMLEKRNLMAHTYDEATANAALKLIRSQYAAALQEAITFLTGKLSS